MVGGELEKIKAEQTKTMVRGSLSSGSKRRAVRPHSMTQRSVSDDIIFRPLSWPRDISAPQSETILDECGPGDCLSISDPTDQICDKFPYDSHSSHEIHARTASLPEFPDCFPMEQIFPPDASLFTNSYIFPASTSDHQEPSFWSQYFGQSSTRSSSSMSNNSGIRHVSHGPNTPDEADLLLYYLDTVYQKQFTEFTSLSRGWLYIIITRTDIVYWSTLSVASYSRGSDSSSRSYENLAILALRKNISLIEFRQGDWHETTFECAAAIVQLMFLEKLRGNVTACKMHLNAALDLVTKFHTTNTIADHSFSASSNESKTDPGTLELIVRILRWFDVLFAGSARNMPLLSTQILHAVQTSLCHSTERTKRQDWIASNFAKVLEVDEWNRKTAKEGRLSVIELVNRASAIENTIISDQEALKTAAIGDQMVSDQSADKANAQGETRLLQVTSIFACTAILYLQIIVAGAHREVPEIRKGVSDTLELFRKLRADSSTGLETLSHLIFPFCVIRCLATGPDREFVSSMAADALGCTDMMTRNIEGAWTVIRECWRLLGEGVLVDPDWTSAVDSLGREFILF